MECEITVNLSVNVRMPGRFAGFDQCHSLFSAPCSFHFERLFTFIIFEPESMELIRIDFLSRLIF